MNESLVESKVVGIQSRISVLQQHEMTTFVHCSKFNSLIQSFKDLIPFLSEYAQENYNKYNLTIMKSFESLENVVDELIQLTIQTSHDSFVQFVLASSTLEVFDQFFSIRETAIKSLKALGMDKAASIFELTPDRLISQDQVDLKHIATIIQQIENDYDLEERKDISNAINARYISLQRKNIRCNDNTNNFVNIPALPSAVDLVVKHEQIQYGREIGHGYSGHVYEGYIRGRQEMVAIKVLNGTENNSAMKRSLKTEITTLSTLSHPSILKLLGYTVKSPFCLIIELLQNGSLADFLKTRPNELTPTDRTLITIDVASGMHYIHEKLLIHRDLKSFNILLDSNKRARICDFGFVRVDSFEPSTGMIGTPQWMAPEVMMCSPMYDNKVDVYSFGIVLWEMLTNQTPYAGIPVQRLPTLIVKNGFRPEIPPGTPESLASLMRDCWDSDPTKRPSFAEILVKLYDPAFHYPGTDEELLWSLTAKDAKFFMSSLSISKLSADIKKFNNEDEQKKALDDLNTMMFEEKIEKNYGSIWKVEKFVTNALRIIRNAPDMLINTKTFINNLLDYAKKAPDTTLHILLSLLYEYLVSNEEKTRKEYDESNAPKFINEMMNNEQSDVSAAALSIYRLQLTKYMINSDTLNIITQHCKGMKAPHAVREKAVETLLRMYEMRPEFAYENPYFVFHLLSYGIITQEVLENAIKISEKVKDCVPTSTITHLLIAYDQSSKDSKLTLISKLISTLLIRFPSLRSMICLDNIINLAKDLPLTLTFFTSFAQHTKETGDQVFSRDVVKALFMSSHTNFNCLDAIANFASYAPSLVTQQLPVNSKDYPRVLKIYTQIPDSCSTQLEAYTAIKYSLNTPDENIACTLLRSFELSSILLTQCGLHTAIVTRIIATPLDEQGITKLGEYLLPALLEMVCCLKGSFTEFSGCSQILKHLAKGSYKCSGLASEILRTHSSVASNGAMTPHLFSKSAARHSSTQPAPITFKQVTFSGPRRRSQDDMSSD